MTRSPRRVVAASVALLAALTGCGQGDGRSDARPSVDLTGGTVLEREHEPAHLSKPKVIPGRTIKGAKSCTGTGTRKVCTKAPDTVIPPKTIPPSIVPEKFELDILAKDGTEHEIEVDQATYEANPRGTIYQPEATQ